MGLAEFSSAGMILRVPGLADGERGGQFWLVPEMTESARRWTGFVCPHCRFVFRAQTNQNGQGVICPSCNRVLKIPTPEEHALPLVVPLSAKSLETSKKRKRHGSRKGLAAEDRWDRQKPTENRNETRQMAWMLGGGGVLLALVIVGVLRALTGGASSPVAQNPAPQSPPTQESPPAKQELTDKAFIAAAEPLANSFLSATTIEQILPLVRDPEAARPRILSRFPDGKIEPRRMTEFNAKANVLREGKALSVEVLYNGGVQDTMSFFQTPEGLKIDWESWMAWSELPWEEFLSSKPKEGKVFRAVHSAVEYYNFGFSNEREWQSYRIISADGEHSVYGYVPRDSPLDKKLRLSPDVKVARSTLLLKFPLDFDSRNQVLITDLLANGWVLDTKPEP